MMNLLNRTAVALLKVIEVETQEATKEQADAWLRRVLLLEKFYRYTNILFRILIPVAIVAAIYLLWRIARNLEKAAQNSRRKSRSCASRFPRCSRRTAPAAR